MEELKACPVCGSQNFTRLFSTLDHFLTHEEFTVVECTECNLRFTNPRPLKNEMPRYYESEEYISHDAGSRSIFHTVYNFFRKISVRNKCSIVKKYSDGSALLDIGCGTGEFLDFCRNKNFLTTGIEPNNKARNFAVENHHLAVYEESKLDDLPRGSFNIITMWHVLEHVHDLKARLNRIKELLAPNGTLILAVPNSDSWDAGKYGEFWAAYDLPRHLYHFTPLSVRNLAERNGFSIKKILPLKMDSYYISLLSEKYRNGRKNFPRAFFHGVISNIHARKNDDNYSSLIYICKTS